jgi:hypothetical protein
MPQNSLSTPKDKTATTPVAPPGYDLVNLPSFIRPANVNTKIVPAAPKVSAGGQIVADVNAANPQTIQVREPQLFAQPVQTHESTHIYQFSRNPQFIGNAPNAGTNANTMYGYGGVEGLEQALKQGKTIADFDLEKQAQMVSDYQKLSAEAIKKGDRAGLSRITLAYHPFVSQLSKIPDKTADMTRMTKQDLTPAAPGLPPATVPGVPMMADPLLGGDPITYTVSQLKNMAAARNPAATGSKTKRFANGKTGVWDGHGWVAQ